LYGLKLKIRNIIGTLIFIEFYSNCHLFFLQDVTEQNQSPSPSHSSITGNTKEREITTDASGRPSPVSVLDAPFLEDDACSGNSRCQPGKHLCTQALFG